MAKASAAVQADTESPAPTGKFKKKLLMIVLIVIVLLVLAAAGIVGLLLAKKGSAGEGAVDPTKARVDLSQPPTFVALDPFVVNLAPAEGERYLQVVMALRVTDNKIADGLKGFMPAIRHRVNLLLSSKLPSELSTLEGREALARQITDQINVVLGAPPVTGGADQPPAGPITAVMFNSFIIQ